MRENEAARYVDALCQELRQRRGYLGSADIATVYFGGGTPSRLTPGQIGSVLQTIRTEYSLDTLIELTVECNPDDVTLRYVGALHDLGVNRISMGVQSFNDDMLRFLGRRHSSAQAVQAVRYCHEAGIGNVSIDLMYGLPGQTDEMQLHDLETAAGLDVQHISSYCLSYEEDSPLDRLRASGRITPQSDETCAAMFDRMNDRLRSAGFEHYEISNFCRPGYYSRHNSSYWDGTPYLGVGAGAHSYDGRSRQWNPSDLDSYMTGVEQGAPRYEIEQLSATDRFNEMVMLRLRTAQGLDLKKLSGLDRERLMQSSRSLIDSGSLQVEGDRLSIPESRMFISDSIISSLFRD